MNICFFINGLGRCAKIIRKYLLQILALAKNAAGWALNSKAQGLG